MSSSRSLPRRPGPLTQQAGLPRSRGRALDSIIKIARTDDVKLRLDNILALLEKTFPKLKGLLPPIYAGRISTRKTSPGSSIFLEGHLPRR